MLYPTGKLSERQAREALGLTRRALGDLLLARSEVRHQSWEITPYPPTETHFMAGSTFQTNPYDLDKLLEDCHGGVLKLPDFQRSWVWDEDRIKSLIASVSRAFPVGALMTLATGGPVNFRPRPVEGAPAEARQVSPRSLLLDGQQRMTSLYQVTSRGKVVETVTPKKKKVKRWFYIDIRKALDLTADREEAIVGVPEDRIIRTDFGRETVLDLSSPEREDASLIYPVSQVFEWD